MNASSTRLATCVRVAEVQKWRDLSDAGWSARFRLEDGPRTSKGRGGDEPVAGCQCGVVLLVNSQATAWRRRMTASVRSRASADSQKDGVRLQFHSFLHAHSQRIDDLSVRCDLSVRREQILHALRKATRRDGEMVLVVQDR